MTETGERTWTETITTQGGELLEQVKQLIREGNVRRIVVKHGEQTVAEFPLLVGVAGALVAPCLAAVGAIVALVGDAMLKDWSIDVERVGSAPTAATTSDGAVASAHQAGG